MKQMIRLEGRCGKGFDSSFGTPALQILSALSFEFHTTTSTKYHKKSMKIRPLVGPTTGRKYVTYYLIYQDFIKMVETHSFESAYARLKEIHRLLHTQDLVDIDAIITLQQEAKELHDFLLNRLSTIEQQNNDVKASV